MSNALDTCLQGWRDVPFDSLGIEALDEARFTSRFYVGPACEIEANYGLKAIFQLRLARNETVRPLRLRLTFQSDALEGKTEGRRGVTNVVEVTVASQKSPPIRNLILAALLAPARRETGKAPSLVRANALYGFPLSTKQKANLLNLLAPQPEAPSPSQEVLPAQHLVATRSVQVSRGRTLLGLYGEFAEDHGLQVGLEFSYGDLRHRNPMRVRLQLQDGRTVSTFVDSWQWSPRQSLRDAVARACRSKARLNLASKATSAVLGYVADVLQDRATVLPQRPRRAQRQACPRCGADAPWRYGLVFGQPAAVQVPHGRCIDGQILACGLERDLDGFDYVVPAPAWQDLDTARVFGNREDWLRALQDIFWVELAPMATKHTSGAAHA